MSGIRERLSTTIYELLHCVTRGFTGGLQPRFANTRVFLRGSMEPFRFAIDSDAVRSSASIDRL